MPMTMNKQLSKILERARKDGQNFSKIVTSSLNYWLDLINV